MNIQNICKFTSNFSENKIHTINFVYEKVLKKVEIQPKNNGIYLVTGGKGKLDCKSKTYELKTGSLFFAFSNVPFSIDGDENFKYIYITFEGSRTEELFTRFAISPVNCIFDGYEGLISFWENSVSKANERNLDLISEAVLLYTFGEIAPMSNSEESELIGKIIKHTENNFTDSELNLNTLSQKLGYNSKYVSRIFKNKTGINFSSYITNVRIQNAVFLIEQGVTAIKNLAILSGYKDPLYFSNVFKNVMGISPSEYILKNKADVK